MTAEQIAMWYLIFGLITWSIGLYRELTNKTVGDAPPILPLAIILFWWIFLLFLIFSKLFKFLKKKYELRMETNNI